MAASVHPGKCETVKKLANHEVSHDVSRVSPVRYGGRVNSSRARRDLGPVDELTCTVGFCLLKKSKKNIQMYCIQPER